MPGINTLSLAHRFIREHVRPGALCIDATAGRGYDTALLCALAGPSGRVIAFDIQKEAIDSTRALLESRGLAGGDVYYITIDARSVQEFNDIVRIVQERRRVARMKPGKGRL